MSFGALFVVEEPCAVNAAIVRVRIHVNTDCSIENIEFHELFAQAHILVFGFRNGI